jgi:UDP-arabinose 4-epimerase
VAIPGDRDVRILVTGGAGYIGSHACKALAARGYEPVTYDDLSRGHRSAVKWGPLEVGDVGDRERVAAALEKHRPAAVMHFAAFAYVGESVQKPWLYYRNNIAGMATLMQAVVEHGGLPVVFSSTCATYGAPKTVPIPEDHPQEPINPYGWSKLVAEKLLKDLDAAHGLHSVSLRYFNAAGSDPDGEIGEQHDPEPHLIPLVLRAVLGGSPISILGTDYDTPDGTCIRDYVHVMDLADAHVLAIDYLLAGGKTCALNLANARGYSVREVIATAERVCGRPIPTKIAPRRPGDPPVLIGRADRARSLLGWQPARAELETQIRDAWRWFAAREG